MTLVLSRFGHFRVFNSNTSNHIRSVEHLASNYSAKQGGGPIAHEAHLGGALGGVVLTLILYPAALGIFLNQSGVG